jgi:hypothetical protein
MTVFEGVLWLTLNCFKEAAYEPFTAKKAVIHTVINRSQKCGTDYKTEVLRHKQFSWTNDGVIKWSLNETNSDLYYQCLVASIESVSEDDFTGGAEFYHTKNIYPKWAKKKIRVNNTYKGNHYFYKDDNTIGDYCDTRSNYENIKLIVEVLSFEQTFNIVKPRKPVETNLKHSLKPLPFSEKSRNFIPLYLIYML